MAMEEYTMCSLLQTNLGLAVADSFSLCSCSLVVAVGPPCSLLVTEVIRVPCC